MVFINGLLALAAVAFTVPLAIHLLFRNRFELMDWGAMHFLEALIRQNRRRMQLQNLLLLLVRCAIPILLAFCMARPVLTGWRALPGNDPLSLVIALDTSDSLAARYDDNQTRFDHLKQVAEQVIAVPHPAPKSRFFPAGMPQRRAVCAKERYRCTNCDQRAASATHRRRTAFDRSNGLGGLRLLSSSNIPARQLILLTDNCAVDLSEAELNALESINDRRQSINPAPEIIWQPWESSAANTNNRRLTKLTPSSTTAVPGQKITWTIEARDDGETPTDSELTLRIDGQDVETNRYRFEMGLRRSISIGRLNVWVCMRSKRSCRATIRFNPTISCV